MNDDRKFAICCNAGPDGHLQVKSQALSVELSQLINRSGTQEIWQSVLVISEESEEGLLTTKIIVWHPDWDQNLQIACIRSRISKEGKTRAYFGTRSEIGPRLIRFLFCLLQQAIRAGVTNLSSAAVAFRASIAWNWAFGPRFQSMEATNELS